MWCLDFIFEVNINYKVFLGFYLHVTVCHLSKTARFLASQIDTEFVEILAFRYKFHMISKFTYPFKLNSLPSINMLKLHHMFLPLLKYYLRNKHRTFSIQTITWEPNAFVLLFFCTRCLPF